MARADEPLRIVLCRLPFYYEAKIVLLVALLVPKFNVSAEEAVATGWTQPLSIFECLLRAVSLVAGTGGCF